MSEVEYLDIPYFLRAPGAVGEDVKRELEKLKKRIDELQAVVDRLESELYEAIEQAHMDGQYASTDGVTFPHIAAQQYRIEYAAKHATEKSE